MTGELLAGRYQLEQELGRGGMATVYLAMDSRLSRRVAVKLMHPGGDGRRAERFRREAELVASLKHPNVLEIHDFGEDAARGPFLVCEWVQGENLRELARRLAPVPPEAAAVLGWELARALGAAHARGVVHRDVKPENVLVARGGPLKLADFGIAALADQERLTSTGAITGSLPYMAPERIDTGAFSPASDVYAVGVILFELCAGTTPHGGKGAAHLAAAVMTKDAPPLSEVVPGTPEPLSALVARCLARDSRLRPVDGVELDALLEDVVQRVAGPPAEASRAFFQDPEGFVARRHEERFQRLLEEGRSLLEKGEGARAAKALNAALSLRPDSPEVVALLRARPKAGRSKALVVGAALAGIVSASGVLWVVHPSRPKSEAVRTEDSREGQGAAAGAERTPPAAEHGGTGASERGALNAGAATGKEEGSRSPGGPSETGAETAREEASSGATGASRREGTSPGKPTRVARTEPKSGGARSAQPSTAAGARSAQGLDEAPPVEPLPGTRNPVASATPSPSAPEATGPAVLRVTTRPWAEVFVDGQSRGYTPRVRELNLSPGTHRLRFVNPGCDAVEEELQVASGQTVTREVTLQVRKAEVSITAPPGARVFVDGVEAGVAPLHAPVNVEHGRHVISARVPGAAPLQREVDVVAGKRTEVVLEAAP